MTSIVGWSASGSSMLERTKMVRTTETPHWLAYYKPNPAARLRLFCFPYAGGAALIYRTWANHLPAEVEVCPVQLPGRGKRLQEPLLKRLTDVVENLTGEIQSLLDKPFAFFGHSMGAMICYEVAHALRRRCGTQPVQLFVSGCRAPQVPRQDQITYNLPDAELVEDLRRLNGTPAEVLEHPELMALMLPLLRADFEVVQTYAYQSEPPLNCPISAFGGLQDSEISPDDIEGWREQTTGRFIRRMFEGNHFFVNSAQPLLLRTLSQELHQIVKNLQYDSYPTTDLRA